MFGYISKIQGLNVGSFIHKMNHFHKKILGRGPSFCEQARTSVLLEYQQRLMLEIHSSSSYRRCFFVYYSKNHVHNKNDNYL